MLTEEQFNEKWKKLTSKQKSFCLNYLQCLDQKVAAKKAGYNDRFLISPNHHIMRKVGDVVDYLISKNKTIQNLVKPQWVLNQIFKMYNTTGSQVTKTILLKELAKITRLYQDNPNIKIQNNIPQVPVTINFKD